MDGPPCILHLPIGIAGDWQGVPSRVRARQRGALCSCECMRLNPFYFAYPLPRGDASDDGLSALIDVHMLHDDFLLTPVAVLR